MPSQLQPFPGVPEYLTHERDTPLPPNHLNKQSSPPQTEKERCFSPEEEEEFKVKGDAASIHRLAGPASSYLQFLER